MSVVQILALLLAVSVAVHIGTIGAVIARRAGHTPAGALLVGASATGTACVLYLTAVGVYH